MRLLTTMLMALVLSYCVRAQTPLPEIWWKMDNADWQSNFLKGRNGDGSINPASSCSTTGVNSSSFVPGRMGNAGTALKMGTNSEIDFSKFYGLVPTFASAGQMDSMTISFWVKFENETNNERILFGAKENEQGGDVKFGLSLKGKTLYLKRYFEHANGTIGKPWTYELFQPGAFDAGFGWYQVIMVFNKTQKYTRLFLGKPNGGAFYGPGANPNDNIPGTAKIQRAFDGRLIWIPGIREGLSNFNHWFMGDAAGLIFDDVKIYKRALTLEQARKIHDEEKSPPLVSFAFTADYGCDRSGNKPNETNYVADVSNLIKSWDPAFIITAGDDTYSDNTSGTQEVGCSANMDDNIGKFYADYIGSYNGNHGSGSVTNRLWPVPGNHDYLTGDIYNGIGDWKNYFSDRGSTNTYYTFTKHGIQFFMIDGNIKSVEPEAPGIPNLNKYNAQRDEIVDNNINNEQYIWLKNELQNSTALYQIVIVHFPPYASTRSDDEADGQLNHFKRLRWPYKEWGADLVLSGDQHFYERNEVKGLTYLVAGIGGHPKLKVTEGSATMNIFPSNETVGISDKHQVYRDDLHWGSVRVDQYEDRLEFSHFYIDYANNKRITPGDFFVIYKNGTNPAGARIAMESQREEPKKEALINNHDGVILYPNPNDGQFQLDFSLKQASEVSYEIYTKDGRQIMAKVSAYYQAGNHQLQLIVKKKPSIGTYIVHIQSAEFDEQRRIMVR